MLCYLKYELYFVAKLRKNIEFIAYHLKILSFHPVFGINIQKIKPKESSFCMSTSLGKHKLHSML